MEFFDVLAKRHSQRSFDGREIEKWKVDKILDAINSAPSAGNLQAYQVFLVEKREILKELAVAAWDKDYIAKIPLALVFCAEPARSSRYGDRGENLYSIQDATIATTYAHLVATELGLSSVWVGAFDDEAVKKVLNIKEGLIPVAILPIGYALAEEVAKTPRRSINDLVKRL